MNSIVVETWRGAMTINLDNVAVIYHSLVKPGALLVAQELIEGDDARRILDAVTAAGWLRVYRWHRYGEVCSGIYKQSGMLLLINVSLLKLDQLRDASGRYRSITQYAGGALAYRPIGGTDETIYISADDAAEVLRCLGARGDIVERWRAINRDYQ